MRLAVCGVSICVTMTDCADPAATTTALCSARCSIRCCRVGLLEDGCSILSQQTQNIDKKCNFEHSRVKNLGVKNFTLDLDVS